MREEVELLKHHADFAAHGCDVLEIVVELDAVDDDPPFVMAFELIDAADQRRLAGPGRTADHHTFAETDLETDRLQRGEVAETFGDIGHLDDGVTGAGVGLIHRPVPRHPAAGTSRVSIS